jgi:hypothetical protein
VKNKNQNCNIKAESGDYATAQNQVPDSGFWGFFWLRIAFSPRIDWAREYM